MTSFNPEWLRPVWPAPDAVQAILTTRTGGASEGPYASMNLGSHVGDAAPHVAANRAQLRRAIGCSQVYLNQVHGVDICRLAEVAPPLPPTADGAYTERLAQACTVLVADCLPVLLCNTRGTAIAAAHAGWRGLAGAGGTGVLEEVVQCFSVVAPVDTAQAAPELIAWMGPCIGPTAFEVGAEVRNAFISNDPLASACFVAHKPQKWLCDLAALARQRLARLGVSRVYGNDSSAAWCTVSNPSQFFSFRRDGVTGRMAASIWLR